MLNDLDLANLAGKEVQLDDNVSLAKTLSNIFDIDVEKAILTLTT